VAYWDEFGASFSFFGSDGTINVDAPHYEGAFRAVAGSFTEFFGGCKLY